MEFKTGTFVEVKSNKFIGGEPAKGYRFEIIASAYKGLHNHYCDIDGNEFVADDIKLIKKLKRYDEIDTAGTATEETNSIDGLIELIPTKTIPKGDTIALKELYDVIANKDVVIDELLRRLYTNEE